MEEAQSLRGRLNYSPLESLPRKAACRSYIHPSISTPELTLGALHQAEPGGPQTHPTDMPHSLRLEVQWELSSQALCVTHINKGHPEPCKEGEGRPKLPGEARSVRRWELKQRKGMWPHPLT